MRLSCQIVYGPHKPPLQSVKTVNENHSHYCYACPDHVKVLSFYCRDSSPS